MNVAPRGLNQYHLKWTIDLSPPPPPQIRSADYLFLSDGYLTTHQTVYLDNEGISRGPLSRIFKESIKIWKIVNLQGLRCLVGPKTHTLSCIETDVKSETIS